jgi:hypothetical protein
MFNLDFTMKLLDRMKSAVEAAGQVTTVLADLYATAWFWMPRLALAQ